MLFIAFWRLQVEIQYLDEHLSEDNDGVQQADSSNNNNDNASTMIGPTPNYANLTHVIVYEDAVV